MKFVVIAVLVLATFFLGLARLVNQMNFYGQVAEIEQLRSDLRDVRFGESEDVVGQVTAWNQTIASMKRYNQIPILDFTIPDGWNKVRTIRIGNAAKIPSAPTGLSVGIKREKGDAKE